MSEIEVVGVAKKELALRVANAEQENEELTATVEKLRGDLVAQREEAEQQIKAANEERDLAAAAMEKAVEEADLLREQLSSFREAFSPDGEVFALKCNTSASLYARETLKQRAAQVLGS